MNEQQRPGGEPDEQIPERGAEQAPEQAADQTPVQAPDQAGGELTQPVNLDRTQEMASYPPPTGSPFLHEPPVQTQPQAPAVPVGQSGAAGQTEPPGGATFGSFPAMPPPPVPEGGASPDPTTPSPAVGTPSSERSGVRGLGVGAISTIVAIALTMSMVAALFGGFAGAFLMNRINGGDSSLPVAAAGSTARPKGSIADIAARSLPSVVTIKVTGSDSSGTGSGFVLRRDGYILTNNHVVDVAATSGTITVFFSDGKSAKAKIIGRDESYDLAVIQVDRRNLAALTFGASSAAVVGDPVIAVGAPLGLDSTVTSGIISALNRPVTTGGSGDSTASFINAIQTDAAINPGNSGGPLLDMSGQVIGVNSAIARVAGSQSPAGEQSGNIGVGFSIPSDQARKTAEQLIATGDSTHPVIGVMIDTTYEGEGVKIADGPKNGSPAITKGGPADKAGLQPGDVILRFGGRPVTDPDEFVVAIRAMSVGDEVELTVRRGGTERSVKMTLQADN